jgi:hypothetical protein
MKRKLVIALILICSFAAALSFISNKNDSDQETTSQETSVESKSSKKDGSIVYKGENDFWEATFIVHSNSTNQLTLKHTNTENKLPSSLTFTLSTAYNQNEKTKKLGTYTLSFDEFPDKFGFSFDKKKLLQSDEKKLLLKITGEDHYQFFNLYVEE